MVNSDPSYQKQQLDSLLEEICEMKQVFLSIDDDLKAILKFFTDDQQRRSNELRKAAK